jgi:hypothetical protein
MQVGSSRFRVSDYFGLWVHDEVIFTTQVHAGFELNRPRLNVSQPQVSADCHEMNLHFDTGKKRSDAVPRACGKRDRRQSMSMS